MQRFHRMLFYLQNTIDSCLGTVLKIARNMASFSSGFFHIHPTWHWGARCPARGERKIMTKSLILERKKDLMTFLWILLLCVVTSLGWDRGIFGICTFHIIPFHCKQFPFFLVWLLCVMLGYVHKYNDNANGWYLLTKLLPSSYISTFCVVIVWSQTLLVWLTIWSGLKFKVFVQPF